MDHSEEIRRWAADRNLIGCSDAKTQLVELLEEIGEIAAGVTRVNHDGVSKGIGAAMVGLTILAEQIGIPIEDCVERSWHKIKDRKGLMIDGIFVKEDEHEQLEMIEAQA